MSPNHGTQTLTAKTSLGFWLASVFLLLILIWINGIKLVPPQHYQKLSQNPFITRTDIDKENYFQETVLLPLLAYYTGWTEPLSFNTLCFVIVIVAYLFYARLAMAKFGARTALLFTSILITAPISTILFSWIGSPDGITFFLTVPFLFTKSTILILVFGILGVTNHIIFGVAAFEILLLRWMAKDGIHAAHVIIQLVGGAIGYLLMRLFLTLNHITIFSRLDFILSRGIAEWLELNRMNLSLTIFSFFNVEWLLVLACILLFFPKDFRYYLSVCALLLINYGITFFTLDKTRIFSLLSWGILIQCLIHSWSLIVRTEQGETNRSHWFARFATIVAIWSFLMPRFYSWNGNLYIVSLWKLILQKFS